MFLFLIIATAIKTKPKSRDAVSGCDSKQSTLRKIYGISISITDMEKRKFIYICDNKLLSTPAIVVRVKAINCLNDILFTD